MTSRVTVRRVTWADQEAALTHIRRTVFMEEQAVPPELEWDGRDESACHVLAEADGVPVGCGRMIVHGDTGKIGRMAVIKTRRGRGIGARLLAELLAAAREAGLTAVTLSAQVTAIGFYEKHGFTPHGDIYMDAGIPHRDMTRTLADRAPRGHH